MGPKWRLVEKPTKLKSLEKERKRKFFAKGEELGTARG